MKHSAPPSARYPSVSVVILAYEEERNLEPAVTGVARELTAIGADYELVIVDDGSTDGTGRVADTLAGKNRRIRVIHHPVNMGFGRTFCDGIAASRMDTVIGFPGDNDTSPALVADLVRHADDADIVMSYPRRTDIRSIYREAISKGFVMLMNILFGLNLKYYNGSFICRTGALKGIPLTSKGFAIYAEAKVRLIRRGLTYNQIPFDHIGRKYGVSKAVSLRSVVHSLQTIGSLIGNPNT